MRASQKCRHCQKDINLSEQEWDAVIDAIDNGTMIGVVAKQWRISKQSIYKRMVKLDDPNQNKLFKEI